MSSEVDIKPYPIEKIKTIVTAHWEKDEPINQDLGDFLVKKSGKLGGKVFLVVYKHNEVLIGKIDNSGIDLENKKELQIDFLKELRMFSEKGELYIWNQGDQLGYRLRIDQEQDDPAESKISRYDEAHFMWGKKVKNGNFIYEKDRGMELKLPFNVTKDDLPLKYLIRNYFEYDEEDGMIRFIDARLVNFLNKQGKEIKNV